MSQVEKTVAALREELGDLLRSVEGFRGQTTVSLDRRGILPACRRLRDDPALNYDFLAALTAVDDWPQEPRFRVIYRLYSISNMTFIGLTVPLEGASPTLASVESVYPNANWHEREVFDMFGITFDGSSDLRRILMPYDWEGHPLRKDYPLGYEEVQFSFNFEAIDRRKKYSEG